MGKSYLIIGGARSGKTAKALEICQNISQNLIYLATAPNIDAEMDARIKAHRNERGDKWQTIEEETNIAAIINANNDYNNCIMVDCLTLWLNNIIYHGHDISKAKLSLLDATKNFKGNIIFVTNELGMGIIPDNPEARSFRDQQGWLNQEMAEICHEVYFTIAGIAQRLKPPII